MAHDRVPRARRYPRRVSLRPPPVRLLSATIIVAATCLGAACSGNDASTERGDAPPVGEPTAAAEQCDLLTVEEIDRSTGWQLPAGEHPDERTQQGLDGTSVCNWEDRSPAGQDVGGAIQVQVVERDASAAYDSHREELVALDPGVTDVDVAGASRAYHAPDSGTVGMLVGDRFVQVTAIGTSLDGTEHLELAADAAERLPS